MHGHIDRATEKKGMGMRWNKNYSINRSIIDYRLLCFLCFLLRRLASILRILPLLLTLILGLLQFGIHDGEIVALRTLHTHSRLLALAKSGILIFLLLLFIIHIAVIITLLLHLFLFSVLIKKFI
ncbi:hypothetical protein PFISCL1PPCAC_25184 [Pristionchus fissidentatus]|uniref:G protein-coupled receptor n=1 Tax=Pristionchus fissidentatus TaxID=1538716 RepID=A0AAV5WS45_9BILA|nr:hypothetical protein PFISCL1PPCAC_25184 [Pristionchus fissidentatus]